ncbi:MAG: hypothetical protein UX78_C0005G0024 [Candidatus Amesbacteria bacterium GW2011_GWA2_47_11]|uniref:Uncharacterized protein n=3 Tax=Candidatus Amesiibacteriota TaxID=1752730 RepID=A0A0G1UL65_9BACT|nr:MAG: hypothetical protein UX78_C0005G0024 [Candidatus Amesbacteria bacterium GW2011_GWA2_47_11]KKU94932.1 MAG: hypothetical protein UY22_C0004G0027 [Candidatus Amesbacteria bacterium GW2011_GWC1_48_10]KKW00141.1 MAG: hypothetical protein UY33_C0015G0028 [Candidatus Amesbacteria bacterium GW2011_GWA1_48_9]
MLVKFSLLARFWRRAESGPIPAKQSKSPGREIAAKASIRVSRFFSFERRETHSRMVWLSGSLYLARRDFLEAETGGNLREVGMTETGEVTPFAVMIFLVEGVSTITWSARFAWEVTCLSTHWEIDLTGRTFGIKLVMWSEY